MKKAVVRFLSVADGLAAHENTIRNEGGMAGLRDPGLLESAVLMPQQQFGGKYLHPGLAEMAAAYLFHITQNHAFNDGDKRAGVLAMLIFLDINGVSLLPAPDALEEMTLAVASGAATKQQLSEWMRAQIG